MNDISRKPTSNDALIRVYKNECHLNARAAEILCISKYTRLRFTQDVDEDGKRIYVSRAEFDSKRAFRPVKHGKGYRIYSKDLCKALAESLDGYCSYYIQSDLTRFCDGKNYYEIIKII